MSNSTNTLNRVKDIVVILLAGAATVLAMVLFTYLISIFMDRCVHTQYSLTEDELEERKNASVLIRKAGLAGMTKEERIVTLQQFFSNRAYSYRTNEADSSTTANESKKGESMKSPETNNDTAGVDSLRDVTTHTKDGADMEFQNVATNRSDLHCETVCQSMTVKVKDSTVADLELQDSPDHSEGVCSICLNEYGMAHCTCFFVFLCFRTV